MAGSVLTISIILIIISPTTKTAFRRCRAQRRVPIHDEKKQNTRNHHFCHHHNPIHHHQYNPMHTTTTIKKRESWFFPRSGFTALFPRPSSYRALKSNLIHAGDIQLDPGSKKPCGECGKTCTAKALRCTMCGLFYQHKCSGSLKTEVVRCRKVSPFRELLFSATNWFLNVSFSTKNTGE